MPNSMTPEQNEDQTRKFLKTNGPPPEVFVPSLPAYLLDNKCTDSEKYMLEMSSVADKKLHWLIEQMIGVKGAQRTTIARLDQGDERFSKIDEVLATWTDLRDKWLSKRIKMKHFIVGLLVTIGTVFLLPFLSLLAVEWIKHHFHWTP